MTIDCWNPETLDQDLLDLINLNKDLVLDFYAESARLMDEHLKSDPDESLKPNRYARRFNQFRDYVFKEAMMSRRIRAWHYTRLTDRERVEILNGIHPSTPGMLQKRVNALVGDGLLDKAEAEQICRESVLNDQRQKRAGKFYMTSSPLPVTDSGVTDLVGHWGGEVAYFGRGNRPLNERLKAIGSASVVELSFCVSDCSNAFSTGQLILAAWARAQGLKESEPYDADLWITSGFDEVQVHVVHTTGTTDFENLGKSYPAGSSKHLKK